MKNKYSVLYSRNFNSKDALIAFIEKHQEHIQTVVIDEKQFQGLDKELIILVAVRYPKIQLIYVFDEYAPENEDFLLVWAVFNLVLSSNEMEIQQLINRPRTFHEALDFKEQHGVHKNCPYCKVLSEGEWYDSIEN